MLTVFDPNVVVPLGILVGVVFLILLAWCCILHRDKQQSSTSSLFGSGSEHSEADEDAATMTDQLVRGGPHAAASTVRGTSSGAGKGSKGCDPEAYVPTTDQVRKPRVLRSLRGKRWRPMDPDERSGGRKGRAVKCKQSKKDKNYSSAAGDDRARIFQFPLDEDSMSGRFIPRVSGKLFVRRYRPQEAASKSSKPLGNLYPIRECASLEELELACYSTISSDEDNSTVVGSSSDPEEYTTVGEFASDSEGNSAEGATANLKYWMEAKERLDEDIGGANALISKTVINTHGISENEQDRCSTFRVGRRTRPQEERQSVDFLGEWEDLDGKVEINPSLNAEATWWRTDKVKQIPDNCE